MAGLLLFLRGCLFFREDTGLPRGTVNGFDVCDVKIHRVPVKQAADGAGGPVGVFVTEQTAFPGMGMMPQTPILLSGWPGPRPHGAMVMPL